MKKKQSLVDSLIAVQNCLFELLGLELLSRTNLNHLTYGGDLNRLSEDKQEVIDTAGKVLTQTLQKILSGEYE